jgi:osmotically-inducible protein OsmY
MSNEELRVAVADELHWEPKVDSESIAVTAVDGVVTLRGTVGSFHEKRAAKKGAERVHGVAVVNNELEVRLMTESRREDSELRADVLQALILDAIVPPSIDAKVDDGFVTLTGSATYKFERDEAERVTSHIAGVADVLNEVALIGPTPEADVVQHAINGAFKRHAKLDADRLTVETRDGVVMVSGTVSSWAEHDDAIAAAWDAPGVRDVDDRIVVSYY